MFDDSTISIGNVTECVRVCVWTGGQPQTCSHLIDTRMLTGVCQAVRMFSPCQFQVYISIGTLESDLLSIKVPLVKPNGHWFIY